MRLRKRSWKVSCHFAWLGLAVACTSEPRARAITGPDGSPMLHVACGADQGACFELAGRGCPGGYKVFPIFDAHDNNFLIRCQGAAAEVALSPSPAPAPASLGPSAFAPVQAQFTAPSEKVSVASKPPPTTGTRNDSEIDLGY